MNDADLNKLEIRMSVVQVEEVELRVEVLSPSWVIMFVEACTEDAAIICC